MYGILSTFCSWNACLTSQLAELAKGKSLEGGFHEFRTFESEFALIESVAESHLKASNKVLYQSDVLHKLSVHSRKLCASKIWHYMVCKLVAWASSRQPFKVTTSLQLPVICLAFSQQATIERVHVTSSPSRLRRKMKNSHHVGVERDRSFYDDLHERSDILIILLICGQNNKLKQLHKCLSVGGFNRYRIYC